jgi:hypothetical protein
MGVPFLGSSAGAGGGATGARPAAVRALLDDQLAGRVERGRTLSPALSLRMWAEFWVHCAASAALTELGAAVGLR